MLTEFSDTATYTIKDPISDQPIDDGKATITLAGPDSAEFAHAELEVNRRRTMRLNASRKPKVFDDPEEVKANLIDILVSCTITWTGISITADNTILTFSKENARMLYSKVKWLREQVETFIGDRANFLQK